MTKIKSIKVTNNFIQINTDNDEKYKISEDDYFNNKYKANMELSASDLNILEQCANFHAAYLRALNRIKYKDRSEYEIRSTLYDEFDIIKPDVDKIIDKLKRYSFIDDERYTQDLIYSMHNKNMGINRIKNDLIQVKISSKIIEEYLLYDFEEERIRASEFASKSLKSIKNKNHYKTINTLRQRLMYRGFKSETINRVISDMDVTYDQDQERLLLEKDIQKSYRTYSRRFEGFELRSRVINHLSGHGYKYDLIKEMLDEMEINNE